MKLLVLENRRARALEWDLVAGRWPEPGNNEVVLTENLLRNRSLEVGARIGQIVDEEDWLNGEWVIVGSFGATEVIGCIGNLDFLQEHYLNPPGLIDSLQIQTQVLAVAPTPGEEAGMEAVLDSLPKDEVFVVHRSRARRNFESMPANIDTILWILNAVTIAVIALALGLLNIIVLMQRANEFGLLAAIGYTKSILMRRVFLEAATTVAVGWMLGILLSIGIYAGLNSLIFVSRGLDALSVVTVRVVLFTVPVPITVTLFSVAIVIWQLHRMDPVAIIERRD